MTTQNNANRVRLRDIRPGGSWMMPRLAAERANQSLYDGDFTQLWSITPSEINGLSLLETTERADIIKLPWFRRATEFLVDALFAEPPRGLPPEMVPPLESAMRYSSMKGVGVLAAEPGRLYAVDPSLYSPLYDAEYRNITHDTIAFVFGDNAAPRIEFHIADRTLVDPPYFVTFNFQGQQLGEMVDGGPSLLIGVQTFGRGYSDYNDMTSIMRELMMRFTLSARILNRHSSPHMTGPAGEISTGAPDYDPRGMWLPESVGGVQYGYLTWDPQDGANSAQIERLLEELQTVTGIPRSAFLRPGESGISRERQMFAVLQRLRRTRRDIERALRAAAMLAGVPLDALEWIDDPFSSFESRVESETKLIEAGLSSTEESGRRLFGS